MTTTLAPRGPAAPRRRGAAAAIAGYVGLAAAAAGASSWLAVDVVTSLAVRVLVVVAAGLVTVGALALASDRAERALDGRGRRWAAGLYWLSTSVVMLALVILAGIAATLLLPQLPGPAALAVDLPAVVVLGALAGALTAVVTTYTGRLLGWAIYRAQRLSGMPADRWRPEPEGRGRRLWRLVIRLAAAGAGGLLASALCSAIVTTATRNHTGGAEAPAPVERGLVVTVLAPIAVWFATTGAAWRLAGRRHGALEVRHRQVHGTHAASLALCLFVVFGWVQAAGVESDARHALATGPALPAGAVPAVRAGSDAALAAAFEPQLRLSRGERWAPTSVAWYVGQNPRPVVDPPFCDKSGAGCYQVPGCDDVAGACAPGGRDAPALYYRVRSSTGPPARGDTPPRAGSPPWTLIQYWVFYNYDALRTGAVDQWHQSDWEQVTVLLERRGGMVKPVEVAYSAHCYGARVPATRVRWTDGSHPVVYVALGSHANYPRSVDVPVRQARCWLGLTPRYLGVAGLFFAPAFDGTRVEIPLDYVAGLRDRATGSEVRPPQPLAAMDATPAITSFRGYWGLDNNLSLGGLPRSRSGAGPPAPQLQGPALKPFAAMLCSDRWIAVGGLPRWVCSGA